MTYRDVYGFLHHKVVRSGDPLTSENAPLFDGLNTALKYSQNKLFSDEAWKSVCRHQLISTKGKWRVTPISDRLDFSRDNWDGVFMTIECLYKKAKKWEDKALLNHVKNLMKDIPIFHKQRKMFIRDVPMAIAVKYRWTRYIGFTVPRKLACLISMFQTHKKKGTLAKTDGKIMGLGLCLAFEWRWTKKLMDKMLPLKRKNPMPSNAWHLVNKYYSSDNKQYRWAWMTWENIFRDYFQDPNHPNCLLIEGE